MISISRSFSFSAGHHLPHHEGKCSASHGHNFSLRVEVAGEISINGSDTGMIMDFGDLDRIVTSCVINRYDHTNLNKFFANPVAENLIQDIVQRIKKNLPDGITLMEVVLGETEKCHARWRNHKYIQYIQEH